MPDLICQNHKCGAQFSPAWRGQVYCRPKCRQTERNWRKAHGERVINSAISGGDVVGLVNDILAVRCQPVRPDRDGGCGSG